MSLSDEIVEHDYTTGEFIYIKYIKEFIERCELRYLKKFGINAGMVVINIMKDEAGDRFK